MRDDDATTACALCGTPFERVGRQRFCSTACRQAAWRQARSAPIQPVVAKTDTVYACEECDARYLGQQRCEDCNRWCHRIGPGGTCPRCDEPVALADLFSAEQLRRPATPPRRR